jgi:hypothetical protein
MKNPKKVHIKKLDYNDLQKPPKKKERGMRNHDARKNYQLVDSLV